MRVGLVSVTRVTTFVSGVDMFIKCFGVLSSVTLVLVTSPLCAQSIGLTDVDSLATSTFIYGLSANGAIGIGTAGTGLSRRALRYISSGGVQDLGLLAGTSSQGMPYTYAFATGISANGTVIVGQSSDDANMGQAYVWTVSGGMVGLGYLNGGGTSTAYAVSSNGAVIVGTAEDGADSSLQKAVLWSGPLYTVQTLGLGKLDSATPYSSSVSGDGKKVVGFASDNTTSYAWRWTSGDSNIAKFMPSSFNLGYSDAAAISLDGTTIVGTVSTTNDQSNLQAYSYKNSTLTVLGLLNGSTGAAAYSYGNAVNQDGTVIVGQATDGANLDRQAGYRWSAATGMQSIEQWLASKGVALNPASAYATNAASVSADGCVVGGQLSNSHGFIARGCFNMGMIDGDDYQSSVNSARFALATMSTMHMDLVMTGYHGNPTTKRLEEGKFSFSFDGDLGALKGVKESDPDLEKLGEFSLAFGGLYGTTWRVGLGRNEFRQRLVDEGKLSTRNHFTTSEVLLNIPYTSMYIDALGYYGMSFNAVDRGYLNGGYADLSSAHVKGRNWGGRFRWDWLNLIQSGAIGITPNVSINYFHESFDGYAENGGSFPITWGQAKYATSDMRIGVDGHFDITRNAALLTKFEAVKRVDPQPRFANGDIIGIGPIVAVSGKLQDHWFRVGLGAEVKEGNSILSIMVNASTENKGRAWASLGMKSMF